jgi:two-component system chemotaxis response regulator CheY
MRRIVQSVLSDLGFTRFTGVGDGQTALNKLKTVKFDLLITDWEMPGMSGLDLVRQVRTQEQFAKLPVLMISSITDGERVAEAVQAGVNGYVSVPFTTVNLREKIEHIMDVKAMSAA